MRILVVYCHPVPESYCAALKDVAIKSLENNGHEVRLVDLYGENFDPLVGCEERRLYNDLPSDQHPLPEHVAHLRWAQGLLFVYPTWWYGLPAMLKGWLDRVWAPGVAFEIPKEDGLARPLMDHVRWIGVITSCGAPLWLSHVIGHPGKKTLLRGIRALCAKRCKTLFLAHYKMDTSSSETRASFLSKVERKLSRIRL